MFLWQDQNILIIPEERENGETEENHAEQNHVQDNENDDGYPQSPDLDAPVSLFAETERVKYLILYKQNLSFLSNFKNTFMWPAVF